MKTPELPNYKWDLRISVADGTDRSLYISMTLDGQTEDQVREAARAKIKGWGYSIIMMTVTRNEEPSLPEKKQETALTPWQAPASSYHEYTPPVKKADDFPLSFFTRSGNKPTVKEGGLP